MVNDYIENQDNKYPYQSYIEQNKKINILSLIINGLSLVLLFIFIFAPMFTAKIDNFDLFYNLKLTDEEQLKLFFTGNVEINFSIFKDFMNLVKFFTKMEEFGELASLSILENLFNPFIILFSIILCISNIIVIINTISNILNIDDNTMLEYNEISRTGTKKTKEAFFKKQTFVTIVLYFVFDIIFTYLIGNLYADFEIEGMCNRYITYISGVSWVFYIFVILLILYLILMIVHNSMKKKMKIQIVRETLKKEGD